MNPSQPTIVGPYQLLQTLGAGGMGEVYLARSPGSRLVALKVIRPEFADDAEFRHRFTREVDAARRVSGFFTPPVVDADTAGPVPWLATAYVPAPSLREVVHGFGPLTEPGVRALGAGLAEALTAIHAAGLVHRDLKPGNVLVAEDGPRVIDFGISKALDGSHVTRTGGTLGTPGYLAPEQISSSRDTGPAADVFSLGCVLVFAATGVNPFGTGGSADLYYRIVYQEPNLDGTPAPLRPMLAACLAKDPARRPPVAALLAACTPAESGALLTPALRQELDRRGQAALTLLNQPYTAPLPTSPTRTRPNRRRFLGIAAAFGAVAVAGSVGTVVALSGGNRPGGTQPVPAGTVGTGGPTVPPSPAAAWSRTAPTAFSNGKLALLDNTLVWFGDQTALGFDAGTGNPLWTGKPRLPANAQQPKWLDPVGSVLYGTVVDQTNNTNLLYGLDASGNQVVDIVLGQASQDVNGYLHSTEVDKLLGVAGGVAVLGLMGEQFGVVAVDLASQRVRWTHPVSNSAYTAVVDEHRCYVQNDTGTVALDLGTGNPLWTTPNTTGSGSYAVLSLSGGTLVLTSVKLLGLDPATGRQTWTAVNESTDLTGPAVTANRAFVADGQLVVFAVDTTTGKEVWHTPSPLDIGAGGVDSIYRGPTAAGNVLALPLSGPRSGVLVLRASDGTPLWAHQDSAGTKGEQLQWSVLASDRTVYGASGSTLYAFPSGA